jgi:general secretion pathway protein M
MNAVAAAWQGRSPAERRVLGVIAAIVAVALVAAFVWLPLERSRARLSGELPRLRASVASLEQQAEAVRRLKAMPARQVAATPVAALSGAPANLPGAQVAAVDERRIRLTAPDVGFAALLDWLVSVQGSHGLRVESARLDALPVNGRVRAELVLSRG